MLLNFAAKLHAGKVAILPNIKGKINLLDVDCDYGSLSNSSQDEFTKYVNSSISLQIRVRYTLNGSGYGMVE